MRQGGFLRAATLVLLLAIGVVGSARAGSDDVTGGAGPASDWAATKQSRLRLIAAVTGSAETGGSRTGGVPLGLQFELAPGWKTYWRSPGDAGLPVTLDWTGSTNLAHAEIAWPAPRRFSLFGLDTFGYEDEVVLPIHATTLDPGKPLGLRLKASYLVCQKVCIPYEARLALDLPASAPSPSAFAQLIDRYASRVPGDGAAQGLRLESVEAIGGGASPRLDVAIASALPFVLPDLIVEGPHGFYFPAPKVTVEDGGRRALFEIAVERQAKAPPLAGSPLVLTMVDGGRGLEAKVAPAAPAGGAGTLWLALGTALIGGLILNLMPCVLPVLSLKLLAFVGHGGMAARRVRLSFLASTVGVLASFMLLAALLAGLKAAGVAVGWGLQFQQPLFIAGMALLLTLFAGNLWGFFEVPLPGFAGDLATAADRRHGLAADVLTGALAALLATPCTAPFLATAVGFALAGGTAEIFVIFLALGLGLAAPYLLVAAWPGLATRLPRPGPWMLVLKRLLGAAFIATAVWLVHVLAGQVGLAASLATALALLVLILLLGLPRLAAGRLLPKPLWRAGLLAAAAAALILPTMPAQSTAPAPVAAGPWTSFSEPRLAALVAQGKTVLVDVTADWCINCQVNEALVLRRGWTAERLAGGGLIGLRADWTRPDPAIARYLAHFGRYGIPFNAVYGPRAPQGIALPSLLTEPAVRDAVAEAAAVDPQ